MKRMSSVSFENVEIVVFFVGCRSDKIFIASGSLTRGNLGDSFYYHWFWSLHGFKCGCSVGTSLYLSYTS